MKKQSIIAAEFDQKFEDNEDMYDFLKSEKGKQAWIKA